jgi:peptide-methionine (S)-S-oxide reductase
VIFYADDSQKRIAEAYIAQLDHAHAFPRPIVTEVNPLQGFFPAEGYHQDYLYLNPTAPYIAYNDMPKVENFRRTFPTLYSDRPVLVSAR